MCWNTDPIAMVVGCGASERWQVMRVESQERFITLSRELHRVASFHLAKVLCVNQEGNGSFLIFESVQLHHGLPIVALTALRSTFPVIIYPLCAFCCSSLCELKHWHFTKTSKFLKIGNIQFSSKKHFLNKIWNNFLTVMVKKHLSCIYYLFLK